MREIEFKHLFDITLNLGEPQNLGDTPYGSKRIVPVTGGDFSGDRIKGQVLPNAAADWVLVRNDASIKLDVRLTLLTIDQSMIFMRYEGIRNSPREVTSKIGKREEVDPEQYYWRIAPFFETSNNTYHWLNNIVSVGTGSKSNQKVQYTVFELL